LPIPSIPIPTRLSPEAIVELGVAICNEHHFRRSIFQCLPQVPLHERTSKKPHQPIRSEANGNAYTLNPTGHPHSSMIATETISLVIYSGETDDVKSIESVDLESAVGPVA
jgi:hypothetical protein